MKQYFSIILGLTLIFGLLLAPLAPIYAYSGGDFLSGLLGGLILGVIFSNAPMATYSYDYGYSGYDYGYNYDYYPAYSYSSYDNYGYDTSYDYSPAYDYAYDNYGYSSSYAYEQPAYDNYGYSTTYYSN